MVNLDIIGNMTGDTLCYYESNVDFPPTGIDENCLNLKREDAGISDHIPFMRAKIPVIFFHTGYDGDTIHTPRDSEELINYDGMVKTLDFLENVILAVDGRIETTARLR